ncbi:MAG: hypothetical protein OEZ35_06615 [Candidatus Bathyarchaeota archaeon]|nr:hypothetical protein [Candidatus Bathyarchaeota archaeon]
MLSSTTVWIGVVGKREFQKRQQLHLSKEASNSTRIRSFEQLQAIGVVVVEQKIQRTTTTATANKKASSPVLSPPSPFQHTSPIWILIENLC